MPGVKYVSVKELAKELGLDRSHLRKFILRLGIAPHKRRTPDSKHQLTLAITTEEAEAVRAEREKRGFRDTPYNLETGFFYCVQLVPELCEKRIKLGYAASVEQRMATHRTVAPTAVVSGSWPCRKIWEPAIIDILASKYCQPIHSEVFECDDLPGLLAYAGKLFRMLPDPQ